jgi:hypothetical protein
MLDPSTGGIKIPATVQADVEKCIRAIRPLIFAACGISEMTIGDLRFTRTAMRNLNCPCMMMVNSQASQSGLF